MYFFNCLRWKNLFKFKKQKNVYRLKKFEKKKKIKHNCNFTEKNIKQREIFNQNEKNIIFYIYKNDFKKIFKNKSNKRKVLMKYFFCVNLSEERPVKKCAPHYFKYNAPRFLKRGKKKVKSFLKCNALENNAPVSFLGGKNE